MQSKITMRYYIPIRIAKIQNTKKQNAGEDVKQKQLSFMMDGNAKWYSYFGKHFGCFLQNYS